MIFTFDGPIERLRGALYPKMKTTHRAFVDDSVALDDAADIVSLARAMFHETESGEIQVSRSRANELFRALFALDKRYPQ